MCTLHRQQMFRFDYTIYENIFQHLDTLDIIAFANTCSPNYQIPAINDAADIVYKQRYSYLELLYDKEEISVGHVEHLLKHVGHHIAELSVRYGYGRTRTEKINRNHEINRCIELYCTKLKKLWLRKGADQSLSKLPRVPALTVLSLHRFQMNDTDLSEYLQSTFINLETVILENMFNVDGDFLMALVSSKVSSLILKLKNLDAVKLAKFLQAQSEENSMLRHLEVNRFTPYYRMEPISWTHLKNLERLSITSSMCTTDRYFFRKILSMLPTLSSLEVVVFYEHNINHILEDLAEKSNLRELNIWGRFASIKIINASVTFLRMAQLEHLSFTSYYLGNVLVEFTTFPNLKELEFHKCCFASLDSMSELIRLSSTLKSIILENIELESVQHSVESFTHALERTCKQKGIKCSIKNLRLVASPWSYI